MKIHIKIMLTAFSFSLALPLFASDNVLKSDNFSTEIASLMTDSFTVNPDHLCESASCEQSFKKLKKYANWGNPEAQVLVATAYLTGNGLAKNDKLAVRNLRKAILSGSNRARWMMSYLYQYGVGIEQDLHQSERLLDKAAEYEFPPALFQKAVATINFETVNNEKAVAMLEIAAKKKHKASMYLLAKIYQHGKGAAADPFASAKLYKKLTFSGYRDSHQQLTSILNVLKENKESTEKMLTFVFETEIIEVIGHKWDMELALEYKVEKMSKSNIYDGNSFGSHLRGRTCLNSSSSCISIGGEDIDGFMRDVMADIAKSHAISLYGR